jgi:4-amino-4-deoxy-L-arabinose transferase-like glycosyltransferase
MGGVLLGVVVAVLFFAGAGRYPLLDPDEARDVRPLFLPTLDFRPCREKPTPYYWLVTLAYRVLGPTEAGARAVSALAALVAVLVIYTFAVPRVGIRGPSVPGSSPPPAAGGSVSRAAAIST